MYTCTSRGVETAPTVVAAVTIVAPLSCKENMKIFSAFIDRMLGVVWFYFASLSHIHNAWNLHLLQTTKASPTMRIQFSHAGVMLETLVLPCLDCQL